MNSKEYIKRYDLYFFVDSSNYFIEKIININNDYDFRLIQDKKNKNYYYLEKYYKKQLKNKIYNTIDCIFMYLKAIKETLQDEKQ